MSHVLDIKKVSVQLQTTDLDSRMRTFDLLELGDWSIWKQAEVDYSLNI